MLSSKDNWWDMNSEENSKEISVLENEILKYSSEMAKGLMANKGDKSYLISDVYETIAVDSYQRKIPSEVL